MIPDTIETPVEVVSTLLAILAGQKGWALVKTWLFAEVNSKIEALDARLKKLEPGA